ncbi:MAG: undecaprenyldiphospho-muramoylpentapeptide beta-N-acetylglucosaminyltransferase [Bacteroidales bacterium]|nr:undecaprenyldiphospho-muramoylpentapeptide beta-N-acetylglucosaminyltransferase [Bacteroidales bacterium]
MEKTLRIIISGGGTGGHIFPAISIANAIKALNPSADILFVGAEGKMEMEKVPTAGYSIKALPVVGFHRRITAKNLSFPFKLLRSMKLAKNIVKEFNPHVAVGVGGYASGPILKVAQNMGIPTLIQEQNSYAGVTNKLLAKKANVICVAYEGMDKYFPKDKIVLTGNPIRQGLNHVNSLTAEAHEFFGIPSGNKAILVVGGSLGARTINESILKGIDKLAELNGVTLLWQTGKLYHDNVKQNLAGKDYGNIKVFDFINRMDYAYSVANVVVSRAGACTISELCLVGKPTILVPSPNVAEDHQTKNALALANRAAAIMITDFDAPKKLVDQAIILISDDNKQKELGQNIGKMALPNADKDIAQKVLELSRVNGTNTN